ncbi:MAG TPA: isoprenylcysteine carboxylmethyltransferase family protein [Vicinamibacterales bacterium]|nr:isoprenylcysteine carboxylmethyltransferase family protein [Vicinamibacterales bacterium]
MAESFTVSALVFLPMLVEALLASANDRAQRSRGGVEPTDDVYTAMRVAYPAVFLLMIAEGLWRGGAPAPLFMSGVLLFAFAKALKWWAITTLGSAWTFRVIVVPGSPLVAGGPYRFVRHPNYIAVVGELVGTALMAGALFAGAAGTAGFAVLLRKRIAVEERALAGRDL